jgi:hypothetical protein
MIFQKLVMIFVLKVISLSLIVITFQFFSFLVITEKPSLHGQVSCNGTTIPCKLEQTKDTHIWHLKFRPNVVGTHKIYLIHNGISIMSKQSYLLRRIFTTKPSLDFSLTWDTPQISP